jgi:hypothetical protein
MKTTVRRSVDQIPVLQKEAQPLGVAVAFAEDSDAGESVVHGVPGLGSSQQPSGRNRGSPS